jgi:hypothetical protein
MTVHLGIEVDSSLLLIPVAIKPPMIPYSLAHYRTIDKGLVLQGQERNTKESADLEFLSWYTRIPSLLQVSDILSMTLTV